MIRLVLVVLTISLALVTADIRTSFNPFLITKHALMMLVA
jgi:hypothetical protein